MRKLLAGIALALLASGAGAQDFPNRPIRWVVPFPPGGGADATARTITQKIAENTGKTFVVDYAPGAGGNIGTEQVARAAPDGYTVLQTTNGHTIQPHLRKLSWDPIRAFAPISIVARYPLVVAVNPAVPVQSLKELIAYAKANPGKLSYGSSGVGGPLNIGAEIFKKTVGVDILHVPCKGNAPMTLAVVSGEVSMVAWLNREIVKAVASPEVNARLVGLGYEPVTNTVQQFNALIAAEFDRFGKIIRETGIKLE